MVYTGDSKKSPVFRRECLGPQPKQNHPPPRRPAIPAPGGGRALPPRPPRGPFGGAGAPAHPPGPAQWQRRHPHKNRGPDYPRERSDLLQYLKLRPGFGRDSGGLFPQHGVFGRDSGQHLHRLLPEHPGQAHLGQAFHCLGPQGCGAAGGAKEGNPRGGSGAGRHFGAFGGQPDLLRRCGGRRGVRGQRVPHHRRKRPHLKAPRRQPAFRQLYRQRQRLGPGGARGRGQLRHQNHRRRQVHEAAQLRDYGLHRPHRQGGGLWHSAHWRFAVLEAVLRAEGPPAKFRGQHHRRHGGHDSRGPGAAGERVLRRQRGEALRPENPGAGFVLRGDVGPGGHPVPG